jgi:hypothetical protein
MKKVDLIPVTDKPLTRCRTRCRWVLKLCVQFIFHMVLGVSNIILGLGYHLTHADEDNSAILPINLFIGVVVTSMGVWCFVEGLWNTLFN